MTAYTDINALETGIMQALADEMIHSAGSARISSLEISGNTCTIEASSDISTPYSSIIWDTDNISSVYTHNSFTGSNHSDDEKYNKISAVIQST